MSLSGNTKKILIGLLVVLIIGFLGYYFIIKSSTPVEDLISSPSDQTVGQDILVLVNKLKTISIDSSFLSSALFTNLKDYRARINPEVKGRTNPFGLIESSAPSSSQKKK